MIHDLNSSLIKANSAFMGSFIHFNSAFSLPASRCWAVFHPAGGANLGNRIQHTCENPTPVYWHPVGIAVRQPNPGAFPASPEMAGDSVRAWAAGGLGASAGW